MTEHLALEYWSTMTPVRLVFLFPLTAYAYLFRPSGLAAVTTKYVKHAPQNNLKNGVIFTWAFMELVMWFWVSLNLGGVLGI